MHVAPETTSAGSPYTGALVEVQSVRVTFPSRDGGMPDGLDVLDDFSLRVERGEFVALFGPNACGKTTILRLVAGLVRPNVGRVLVDPESNSLDAVGIVFQSNYSSTLPWRTAIDNVAFPLELRGVAKRDRRKQARALLERLRLELPERSYPYELSGGQQQLIAIARSLVCNQRLLLLDEPFEGLDYQTRLSLNEHFMRIWDATQATVLFVSHDIDEALLLSDRLVLLTSRPASIAALHRVELARPRSIAMLDSPEHLRLRSKVLGQFLEEIAK